MPRSGVVKHCEMGRERQGKEELESVAKGENGGKEGTNRPRMTGKYEFSTSMTCCSTVLLPTCLL
jgi:hypothetical protein